MADSFADALLKAGKISQADIDQRKQDEADKIKKAREEKEKAEKAVRDENDRQRKEHDTAMKPFDDLWNNEKSHKFMAHLIFAYSPLNVGDYAWGNEELKTKHCCICRHKLLSKDDLFKKGDEICKAGLESLKDFALEDGTLARAKYQDRLKSITGNRVLGVVSPDSNAAFCPPCYDSFGEWVGNMIIRGNREINGIIRRKMIESLKPKTEAKENGDGEGQQV